MRHVYKFISRSQHWSLVFAKPLIYKAFFCTHAAFREQKNERHFTHGIFFENFRYPRGIVKILGSRNTFETAKEFS